MIESVLSIVFAIAFLLGAVVIVVQSDEASWPIAIVVSVLIICSCAMIYNVNV